MADVREGILSELLTICNSIPGVAAAARNRTDAIGLSRPAIIINDGVEEIHSQPDAASETLVAVMEMKPEVQIFIGGAPDRVGTLANLYLARLRYRVLTSSAIKSLVSKNGKIFIEGAALIPLSTESKEARMDSGFLFRYFFRAEDLADL